MSETVLLVDKLQKTFKKPFTGKKVEAVKSVSFEVKRGETFGFLGPNGAGKTTTIKMLTGLIAPTAGKATIFGSPIGETASRKRMGFLPENPYIYPYLTPREFVSMCARLSGVSGKTLKSRVEDVIRQAGIFEAIDRPAKQLSKGMLQRTGLAAALVHEPEFLLLDEPMSGLDPVGRKEVRDIIVAERKAGRTVMFSSHVLADVELLCDRVCILKKGEVVVSGALSELIHEDQRFSEITLVGVDDSLFASLGERAKGSHRAGDRAVFEVEGDEGVRKFLGSLADEKIRIESVIPKRETLEQIFVRQAI